MFHILLQIPYLIIASSLLFNRLTVTQSPPNSNDTCTSMTPQGSNVLVSTLSPIIFTATLVANTTTNSSPSYLGILFNQNWFVILFHFLQFKSYSNWWRLGWRIHQLFYTSSGNFLGRQWNRFHYRIFRSIKRWRLFSVDRLSRWYTG